MANARLKHSGRHFFALCKARARIGVALFAAHKLQIGVRAFMPKDPRSTREARVVRVRQLHGLARVLIHGCRFRSVKISG